MGATIIETFIGDPDLYRVRLQPNTDLDDTIRRYIQEPDVVRATKNLAIFPFETIPIDPRFPDQWGLKNRTNPGRDIRATFAWDIKTGDPNMVIAVIDSGVDYN